MGSYNLKGEKLISRMINSFFYLFKFVFILKENNRFRLVVIQENHKSMDREYKTIKGAKIACTKWLRYKAGSAAAKPVWSLLYPPDERWLQDKLSRKKAAVSKRRPAPQYLGRFNEASI